MKFNFTKKTLTFSFLLLLGAEFIYNISNYVIQFGLGRILGVADYGRYSLVIGFTTMIIILVGRSVPTAMAKRISENSEDFSIIKSIKKTSAKLQFFIITSLTIIFYFLAPVFANIFNDKSLLSLFQLSALIIPAFALSSFHTLYFNGLKRFDAMTALKVSRGVFRIFWIIVLAYTFSLQGAIWGAILAPLSVFLVAIFIEIFILKHRAIIPKNKDVIPGRNLSCTQDKCKRKESFKQSKNTAYPWQKIISFAKIFVLFTLFYEFYIRLDLYLIKIILKDDYLTGIYNSAMTISLIPYYLIFALTFILFPTISSLKAEKNHQKIKKIITKVILLLFVTLIPIALILAFVAPYLIIFFFGVEFTQASQLVPLMLGGTIFATIFFVLASIWNGADYTKTPATITALAIIISITLNYIFIPIYGIMATAAIFSLTSAFMGISALILTYFRFVR